MGKKNKKTDIVITADENLMKNHMNEIITTIDDNDSISIPFVHENSISNASITDLIAYEKACALICKKYEITFRLNDSDNTKFRKYQSCYEKIFSELEKRVENICKD